MSRKERPTMAAAMEHAEEERPSLASQFGHSWEPDGRGDFKAVRESTGSVADQVLDAERDAQLRTIAAAQDIAKLATEEDGDFLLFGLAAPFLCHATEHARFDPVDEGTAKAQRRRGAKREDPDVRFGDEIAALIAYEQSKTPTRAGDLERMRGRLLLRSTIQSSVKNREPLPDPYLEAVRCALDTLDPAHLAMLRATYVELHKPRQSRTARRPPTPGELTLMDEKDVEVGTFGTNASPPSLLLEMVPARIAEALHEDLTKDPQDRAKHRYKALQEWRSKGRKVVEGEKLVPLPPGTATSMPETALSAVVIARELNEDVERTGSARPRVSTGKLVAEALGLLPEPMQLGPEATKEERDAAEELYQAACEAEARRVGETVKRTRKELARRLRLVDFDELRTCEPPSDAPDEAKAKPWLRCMRCGDRFLTTKAHLHGKCTPGPRYVIPPLTDREMKGHAILVDVEVCAGAQMVDGARTACGAMTVREDVSARPSCPHCGKPQGGRRT